MNLSDIKNADKKLKFVVENNGSVAANVAFDLSLDCPASAVIEKDWVIAAGDKKEDEFGRVFLDVLKEKKVIINKWQKFAGDNELFLSSNIKKEKVLNASDLTNALAQTGVTWPNHSEYVNIRNKMDTPIIQMMEEKL